MHIGHILLVEATDKKEAEYKVNDFVESYAQNGWSDWSEIGGRWDGEFDGSNILCYKGNEELFEKKIKEWQEGMEQELERLIDQVGDYTISELVSIGKKNQSDDKDYFGDDYLAVYRAKKALKIVESEGYCSHSQVFDIEYHSANLKDFRNRVVAKPEEQFVVMWDFHF
jgi:hypothetical protein